MASNSKFSILTKSHNWRFPGVQYCSSTYIPFPLTVPCKLPSEPTSPLSIISNIFDTSHITQCSIMVEGQYCIESASCHQNEIYWAIDTFRHKIPSDKIITATDCILPEQNK